MADDRNLYEALRNAFTDFDELRRLIYFELGDRLTSIATNPSLDDGAFQVIEWAHTRGKTAELIAALKKERPHNPLVQALAGPAPARFRHFTATLPKVDPYLTGRTRELALLDTAWGDPATNVVQIVASGGTGKTALLDHWFRRHLTEATVFGWSFYSQGTSEGRSQTSSDPFFAQIFRWLNLPALEPTASPWTKAAVLAERLRSERVLLLLDGLEPLQDAEGEMKDAAMKALLGELETENLGLALCTTRVRITDVPGASVLLLDNLSPEAGSRSGLPRTAWRARLAGGVAEGLGRVRPSCARAHASGEIPRDVLRCGRAAVCGDPEGRCAAVRETGAPCAADDCCL